MLLNLFPRERRLFRTIGEPFVQDLTVPIWHRDGIWRPSEAVPDLLNKLETFRAGAEGLRLEGCADSWRNAVAWTTRRQAAHASIRARSAKKDILMVPGEKLRRRPILH